MKRCVRSAVGSVLAALLISVVSLASRAHAEIININLFTNGGEHVGFQQFDTSGGEFIDGQGILYAAHTVFFTDPYQNSYPFANILFRSAATGGGIVYEGDSSFNLTGPQLYYGMNLPTVDYCCLQYGLHGTVDGGAPIYYQVYISASDSGDFYAAPEPAMWALMLMGVALLGVALRRMRGRREAGEPDHRYPAVKA